MGAGSGLAAPSRTAPGLAAPRRVTLGFTLIELLVAMALLSMVGLALVGLGRFQLAAVGRVGVASMAAIEADNLATDALVGATAPAAGAGDTVNGGVALRWSRAVLPGPTPGTVVVTIAVRGRGDSGSATRALVRPA